MTSTEKSIQVYEKKKRSHLIQSIVIDLIGMSSYLVPVIAEVTDIVVAPILGLWIFFLYRKRIGAGVTGGIIGVIEELLPSTDLVPTALIMWLYTYKVNKEKTLASYEDKNEVKTIESGTS